MNEARQIREAIQRLTGTSGSMMVILDCEVLSVNKSERNCVVKIIDGATPTQVENVMLSAEPNDGLICIPAIGSLVRVAFHDKKPRFVVQFSDLDECRVTIAQMEFIINAQGVFQGDESYGGVVKADDVTSSVNSQCNSIIQAAIAAFTALGAIDSGVSLTAFNSAIASYQPMISINIQNQTFKHGN
jgi:hypothetical protein